MSLRIWRQRAPTLRRGAAVREGRDATAPPAGRGMKPWAGRDASSRIANKSRRRRESLNKR